MLTWARGCPQFGDGADLFLAYSHTHWDVGPQRGPHRPQSLARPAEFRPPYRPRFRPVAAVPPLLERPKPHHPRRRHAPEPLWHLSSRWKRDLLWVRAICDALMLEMFMMPLGGHLGLRFILALQSDEGLTNTLIERKCKGR